MADSKNNSTHASHKIEIDFSDMQALARFGHGRLVDSQFLLLTIRDRVAAGHWLTRHLASSAIKAKSPPDTALQIAFSPAGMTAMGLSHEVLHQFSEQFVSGMNGDDNRSRRLGDVGINAPSHGRWGSQNSPRIHIVLLLYALEGAIEEYATWLAHTFGVATHEQAIFLPVQ